MFMILCIQEKVNWWKLDSFVDVETLSLKLSVNRTIARCIPMQTVPLQRFGSLNAMVSISVIQICNVSTDSYNTMTTLLKNLFSFLQGLNFWVTHWKLKLLKTELLPLKYVERRKVMLSQVCVCSGGGGTQLTVSWSLILGSFWKRGTLVLVVASGEGEGLPLS